MKLVCGITGSTGGVGTRLVKYKNFKFKKFNGNITNKNQVKKWIQKNKFDLFIHLAAIVPTKKVEEKYNFSKKVNVSGTKNIFNNLVKFQDKNLKWFFFPSTCHVYDSKSKKNLNEKSLIRPMSKYGKTKLLCEKYFKHKLKKTKIKCCIGRVFSFTHSSQSLDFLVPALKNKIKKKTKTLELNNLNHYRDFISIFDLCRAIIFLSKIKFNGTINIASGKSVYLKNIAKKLNKSAKKKLKFNDNKVPTYLVAGIKKLKRLGFKHKYNFLNTI